ncbi:MAG: efflux RND transporter periplasmic adaptor subunit [Bacteroidota bacterium]|jgi:HlyD family secretion protein|nr:efflux RND transporter periplasmic adaptor subunit [Bacteroidota bacterium]
MTIRALITLLPFLLVSACGDGDGSMMEFTGIMEATTVRVSAETPGRLLELRADEGDAVNRDSTLAMLETERTDYQLAQSAAMLDELAKQEKSAEQRLRAARVQRDNLARRLERFQALLAEHAVTTQAVDDLRTQHDAADAELAAAVSMLDALRSKRAQIDAGGDLVRKQQRDARIVSPLDGHVLVRYAEVGELLGVGSPIFDVANIENMWTRIYVAATQLPHIRVGQRVQVVIDGVDATLEGTIRTIADNAEFTPKTILTEETRTTLVYAVKVGVRNRDGLLKIGMPVTVRIETAR